MKKIWLFLICLIGVVGCSCTKDTASDAVKKYLDSYKGLSDSVMTSLDNLVASENLEDENKETYKEILKKQYRDLEYEIENEDYDGDTAKITVKITIYDLYKANKNSSDYLKNNHEEFLTDGIYDASKYIKYKLEELKNMKDRISYTLVFKVNKIDGNWVVEQPDDEALEKIHGIYDYENE